MVLRIFAPRGANLQLQRIPHTGAWGDILSPLRGCIRMRFARYPGQLVIDRRCSRRLDCYALTRRVRGSRT